MIPEHNKFSVDVGAFGVTKKYIKKIKLINIEHSEDHLLEIQKSQNKV